MSHLDTTVDPMLLADLLTRWALRREKVLFVLDHKSARSARRLARECIVLAVRRAEARTVDEIDAWHRDWTRVREEVRDLVATTARETPPLAPPAPAPTEPGARDTERPRSEPVPRAGGRARTRAA
jgi:hypothetical protein